MGREVIYESAWGNLFVDRVRFPAGRIIDEHHFLDFEKQAVTAVVQNERDQILMVEAYRYVTDSIEWETPAGSVDEGESIAEAAQREVLEETGYQTANPELIYTYNPMNGISNKIFHVVRCQAGESSGHFDQNEVRSFRWFSISEVRDLTANNQIMDGFTLSAVLLHQTS